MLIEKKRLPAPIYWYNSKKNLWQVQESSLNGEGELRFPCSPGNWYPTCVDVIRSNGGVPIKQTTNKQRLFGQLDSQEILWIDVKLGTRRTSKLLGVSRGYPSVLGPNLNLVFVRIKQHLKLIITGTVHQGYQDIVHEAIQRMPLLKQRRVLFYSGIQRPHTQLYGAQLNLRFSTTVGKRCYGIFKYPNVLKHALFLVRMGHKYRCIKKESLDFGSRLHLIGFNGKNQIRDEIDIGSKPYKIEKSQPGQFGTQLRLVNDEGDGYVKEVLHFGNTDYVVNRILGKGGFGTVVLVTDTVSSCERSLKIVPRGWKSDLERHGNELVKSLDSKGICQVYDYKEGHANLMILMEYIKGRTLYNVLTKQRLSNKQKRSVFNQLVSTLKVLHEKGVYHCDLKPENILCFDDEQKQLTIKMIDFGCAQNSAQFTSSHLLGTRGFILPGEQAFTRENLRRFDAYALGVVLLELFTNGNSGFLTSSNPTRKQHLEALKCAHHSLRVDWVLEEHIRGLLTKGTEVATLDKLYHSIEKKVA